MPRDQRLYMTFPNDFWMHPKVATLSTEAKWAFVEMNGYSRMQDLDGRIPMPMAERMWTADVIGELVDSHVDRPLVLIDGDLLVIRDYAEHQQTTAERERLHVARAEAGRKGGLSKGQASALAKAKPALAEIETESETDTSTPNGVETRKRAHALPKSFAISDEMRAWAAVNAPLVDVDAKLPEFVTYWRGVGKPMRDWGQTWRNGMLKQQGFAVKDGARHPRPSKDQQALEVLAMGARLQQQEIEQ